MHMKHGTHFVTCGRGRKFVFGEVLSLGKRERLMICAFPNVKLRYTVNSRCYHQWSMERSSILYQIPLFPPCESQSFMIVVLSCHSVRQCTTIRGCNTNLIAFLYKNIWTVHLTYIHQRGRKALIWGFLHSPMKEHPCWQLALYHYLAGTLHHSPQHTAVVCS